MGWLCEGWDIRIDSVLTLARPCTAVAILIIIIMRMKNIHPPPSEELHPVTDPLGKTVLETRYEFINF